MKKSNKFVCGDCFDRRCGFSLTAAAPANAAPVNAVPVNAVPNTQVTLPLETIRTIQSNAAAAHDNAGIYQWASCQLRGRAYRRIGAYIGAVPADRRCARPCPSTAPGSPGTALCLV